MATKRRVVIGDACLKQVALELRIEESTDGGATWRPVGPRQAFPARGALKEALDGVLTSMVLPLVVERVTGSAINRG